MVEFQVHKVEPDQSIHIETIEVHDGDADSFFLNEDLELEVTSDGRNLPGEMRLSGDLSKVIDLGICYEDPSSKLLVQVDPLDPMKSHILKHDAITRLRYDSDGVLEEVRLIYNDSSMSRDLSRTNLEPTTQRMRRIHQEQTNNAA